MYETTCAFLLLTVIACNSISRASTDLQSKTMTPEDEHEEDTGTMSETSLLIQCTPQHGIQMKVHKSELPSNVESNLEVESRNPCCSILVHNVTLDGLSPSLCPSVLTRGLDTENEIRIRLTGRPNLFKWTQSALESVPCPTDRVVTTCSPEESPGPIINAQDRLVLPHLHPMQDLEQDCLRKRKRWRREWWEGKDITMRMEFAPVIWPMTHQAPPTSSSPIPRGTNEIAEDDLWAEDSLECVIESYPMATVYWFKGNQSVEEAQNLSYSVRTEPRGDCTTVTTLRIVTSYNGTPIVESFGDYACFAENVHGKSAAFLKLVEPSNEDLEPLKRFNVTGFILGMMPPLMIAVYIVIKLGYRSRYAQERTDQGDDLGEEPFFVGH